MTKRTMISVVSDARICAGNPNPANALNSYRDNGPAANPIHLKCRRGSQPCFALHLHVSNDLSRPGARYAAARCIEMKPNLFHELEAPQRPYSGNSRIAASIPVWMPYLSEN